MSAMKTTASSVPTVLQVPLAPSRKLAVKRASLVSLPISKDRCAAPLARLDTTSLKLENRPAISAPTPNTPFLLGPFPARIVSAPRNLTTAHPRYSPTTQKM